MRQAFSKADSNEFTKRKAGIRSPLSDWGNKKITSPRVAAYSTVTFDVPIDSSIIERSIWRLLSKSATTPL